MIPSINNFWEQKKNQEPMNVIADIVRVDNNPNFNISILKQNIDDIDNMSDAELRRFIHNSFKSIMKNLFTGMDASKYVMKFTNVRFLDAFTDVVMDLKYLDMEDLIICNSICYDYLTYPNRDSMVLTRMLKLSSIINRAYLPRLLGLGLSQDLSSMLLIARFSNINLAVCVKRVNFILITQPKQLMSEMMIEEIIKILYDVMGNDFCRIFPTFMMDIIPEYDENNLRTHWITDDVQEVNSVLNLSMLNILNSLTTINIRTTLINYAESQTIIHGNNKQLRFSLNNLSDDYYRINDVVENLICEGIYVP